MPPLMWIQTLAIACACAVLGLMAGFFGTYSFNVNLAMLQVDGPVYAEVQSLLNRNVRHAGFFLLFFGAGLFPLAAALLNWSQRRRASFWLLLAAAGLYIAGVIFWTQQVNLPLNAYTESWPVTAPPDDWETTRQQWNSANMLRVWVSLLALMLSLAALVLRLAPTHHTST